MQAMLGSAGLNDYEVGLLAAWCYDRRTSYEIAAAESRPRSTIRNRLNVAFRKLQMAGISLSRPRQGRPKGIKTVLVDAEAMTRLVRSERDGRVAGKWINANEKRCF